MDDCLHCRARRPCAPRAHSAALHGASLEEVRVYVRVRVASDVNTGITYKSIR